MIDWNARHYSGTSYRAMYESPWNFEETVARIVAASGQPATSADGYKTSVDFVGSFNGEVFTLYDYKEDRAIHIGGLDRLDVVALVAELTVVLTAVTPAEYTAKEHYDERKTHGWPPPHGRRAPR